MRMPVIRPALNLDDSSATIDVITPYTPLAEAPERPHQGSHPFIQVFAINGG
jgi:hypothetical protein